MSDVADVSVSHFGVCVTDIERSKRFYTEAIGFTFDNEVQIGPPFDKLTELPTIKGRAYFMLLGGFKLELLQYDEPEAIGPAERRPMHQLGITHMSLIVQDLQAIADRIDAMGGEALRHTLLEGPHGAMMFATDPDGTRLELWQKPDQA